MSRVIVTGAQGFVGRACIPALLDAGFEVHALSRGSRQSKDSALTWHSIDLMDSCAVNQLFSELKATHCLHLAWVTKPGVFWQSTDNLRWLAATLTLATAFREHGGQRLVATGSCAEYKWDETTLNECTSSMVPSSLYGQCKLSAQQILSAFAGQSSLSFAWARLFFMYGPHAPDTKFPRVIIDSLLRGETVKTSSGEQVRDFLHVEDTANALVTLSKSEFEGPINVASGEAVTLKDIIQIIAKKLDGEALISWGESIPSHEPKVLLADTKVLNTELDWRPQIGLVQGIEKLIAETKNETIYDSI